MTKLEEEIKDAIVKADSEYDFEENGFDAEAKAAAEVAKNYICMAWFESTHGTDKPHFDKKKDFEIWLKENGIE